jgi:hypothetical protein
MTQYYKKNEEGEFVEADLSQEDINQAVKDRVDRINRKYSDYEDLKKQIEDFSEKQKKDEERINELLTDKANLEDDLKVSKLETEKVKIVSEFKLSDDLAEFITGDTAEQMRERAEKLAHNTTQSTVDVQKIEKPEPKKSDMAELADKLFGSNQQN